MDTLTYFNSEITDQSQTFAVYRQTGGTSYDTTREQATTVRLSVTDLSAQSSTVTEGTDQDISYRGLVNPHYDENGQLVDVVQVNDELRHIDGPRRYRVETKVGRPNDIDPDVWELGLRRANSD